jgi:hypothetical protein
MTEATFIRYNHLSRKPTALIACAYHSRVMTVDRDIEQRARAMARDVAEIIEGSTSCVTKSAERLKAIAQSAKRSQEIDNGILRGIAFWRSREWRNLPLPKI